MTYIYDGFTWDHCLDSDYAGNLDFGALLDGLYDIYTGAVDDATSDVELIEDEGENELEENIVIAY